jgi:hypothetical protein
MRLYQIGIIAVLCFFLLPTSTKHIPIQVHTNMTTKNARRVTIIGSVHGNEPVGYYALSDMLDNNELNQYCNRTKFVIINDPNEHGRKHNKRNSLWGDINRKWPTTYESVGQLIYPVRTMLPYVNTSDVVIDIHEAKGYNRCQKSLGNTIYISDATKKPMFQLIIDELNKKLKNEWSNNNNNCDQWDIITKLPRASGSLDEYVNIMPKDVRPCYVLIEVPGQNNIQNLARRIRTTKFLIHRILNVQL